MTATHSDQIVEGYLARLEAALRGIPASRRQEILEEVRSHIAEARAGLATESDADLLNILDRLGDPVEVAGSAARSPDAQPARFAGLLEIGALVLTPLLWPAGVILLWASPAWTTREKLIGTLVPPGGYWLLLPLLWLGTWLAITPAGGRGCVTSGTGQAARTVCTSFGAPGWAVVTADVVAAVVVVAALVLPVVAGIFLARRLEWRRAAAE